MSEANYNKAISVLENEKKRKRKNYNFVCYKDRTKKGISIKAGWQDRSVCSCCGGINEVSSNTKVALTKLADEVTPLGRFVFYNVQRKKK